MLLIEDAVYAVNPQHIEFSRSKNLNTFVLRGRLEARGMVYRVSPSVHIVDYDGFVELTVEQPTSVDLELNPSFCYRKLYRSNSSD